MEKKLAVNTCSKFHAPAIITMRKVCYHKGTLR